MSEVADAQWLIAECILGKYAVAISYVCLSGPMMSIQMTAMTLVHRNFCTEKPLYKEFLHTDAFTHRNFYTEKSLHRGVFVHRSFTQRQRSLYTGFFLHRETFTHAGFYTQKR